MLSAIIRQHPIIIITTTEYVKVTNHCGVQVRGNIEDFVQTHGRVDALVLFASTNEDNKYTQKYQKGGKKEREREREISTCNFLS